MVCYNPQIDIAGHKQLGYLAATHVHQVLRQILVNHCYRYQRKGHKPFCILRPCTLIQLVLYVQQISCFYSIIVKVDHSLMYL